MYSELIACECLVFLTNYLGMAGWGLEGWGRGCGSEKREGGRERRG